MTRAGQANNPSYNRFKKMNRPPEGQAWVWLTQEMISSPAWRAMSHNGQRVVSRIMIEHMKHGGNQNGSLPITYSDFAAYGIRRSSIKGAILDAIRLGFVDLVETGIRGHGIARRPHRFGLTWLPRADFTPASNRWKAISMSDIKKFAQSRKCSHLVTQLRPSTSARETRRLKTLDFSARKSRSA